MQLTDKQIDLIVHHFIVAAIWADVPDTEEFEGVHIEADDEARAKVRAGVVAFYAEHAALVHAALSAPGYGDACAQDFGGERRDEWPFAAFGHDLYLTTQGHGVGFWDRVELEPGSIGAKLTNACDYLEQRGKPWIFDVDFDAERGRVIFY
ncbi:TPA: hypothetical protein SH447_004503 [Salmonella enterica]|jgi:hypothetical protein|nr:hypothetical protein [Staphylococcus aureus]HDW3906739.1 hypothetical protein [Escherichia coli]HEH8885987.1 hypothetical protein [Salmonella enterica]